MVVFDGCEVFTHCAYIWTFASEKSILSFLGICETIDWKRSTMMPSMELILWMNCKHPQISVSQKIFTPLSDTLDFSVRINWIPSLLRHSVAWRIFVPWCYVRINWPTSKTILSSIWMRWKLCRCMTIALNVLHLAHSIVFDPYQHCTSTIVFAGQSLMHCSLFRDLLSNPFVCNCHMKWLKSWLKQSNIATGYPK